MNGRLKLRSLRLPDVFIEQNSPGAMLSAAGLDSGAIARAALSALELDASEGGVVQPRRSSRAVMIQEAPDGRSTARMGT
jgi:1-deoxy-D-xylulose-5-phosphate synthase